MNNLTSTEIDFSNIHSMKLVHRSNGEYILHSIDLDGNKESGWILEDYAQEILAETSARGIVPIEHELHPFIAVNEYIFNDLKPPKKHTAIFTHNAFKLVREQESKRIEDIEYERSLQNAERGSSAYYSGYDDWRDFSNQDYHQNQERRIFPRIKWFDRNPVLVDMESLDNIPF